VVVSYRFRFLGQFRRASGAKPSARVHRSITSWRKSRTQYCRSMAAWRRWPGTWVRMPYPQILQW